MALAAATLTALQVPWLGLTLKATADGGIRVVQAQGPAAAIPVGARLIALQVANQPGSQFESNRFELYRFELRETDLLEEPDVLADYREMEAFFTRQSAIAAVLSAPQVNIQWQEDASATLQTTRIQLGVRPLAAMPGLFWFQLAVSISGCLMAGWVWALRPGDWGTRMFLMTGFSFLTFAFSAAIYSTRELALEGDLFRTLSAINHAGAVMFGAALVATFLHYPSPLLRPRYLVGLFLFYASWWLIETLRWAPDLDWGHRFAVMSEMLLALLLAIVQWIRNQREPANKAALRWFILSLLLGSGLFILTTVTSVSLGWLPPLPQGYAFGFFLFIYLGIALGLRRYRLFELDIWAYRLLLWLGGVLAVVGLDAVLIFGLNWSESQALVAALWAVGLIYLPVRYWLWQYFIARPRLQLHELMPDVVRIAFQPSSTEREAFWSDLLQRLYQPLEQKIRPVSLSAAAIEEEGLALCVPACAGIQARALRYPDRGGRLFTHHDSAFIDALVQLMNQAESSRQAQESAASNERKRIARDMHDDVGARLLMLAHHAPSAAIAELARAAMHDLRTALNALDTTPISLGDAVADWRAEANSRCERVEGDPIVLTWQAQLIHPERLLTARQKSLIERLLRESLTNAIKHAAPSHLQVFITEQWVNEQVDVAATLSLTQKPNGQSAQQLQLVVINDGSNVEPQHWKEGRGLRGMRQRLAEFEGHLAIESLPAGGTQLTMHLSL